MKILVVIAVITLLVMPNSWETWAAAGAIMDDDTGEMNVNAETMQTAAHFRLIDQLRIRSQQRLAFCRLS